MKNKKMQITYRLFMAAVLCLFSLNALMAQMDINQTLSDHAQQQTIAFDGVAFITGDRCGDSFLPPGKVADFCGFQFLRDNDPTNMGHNTDFVTIIAFNMLHLLDVNQMNQLIDLADLQLPLINEYGYNRLPIIDAFRRYYEHDMPLNATGLNKDSVLEYSATKLYRLDGQISYQRTKVMGSIIRNMTAQQKNTLDSLKSLNGIGNWPNNLSNPLQGLGLTPQQSVAVMTYASEMYSWYAGSVDADVYFCPERQGTLFGSFYMKDIPAMGNPGYSISPNMTDSVGQVFLTQILDTTQEVMITCLVDSQRTSLYSIVDIRDSISNRLREFMVSDNVDSAEVIALSEQYGRLDGMICYLYATHFSWVGWSCNPVQMDSLMHLRNLDSFPCNGAYLYSENIAMPQIINTDFFFTIGTGIGETDNSGIAGIYPNPFTDKICYRNKNGTEIFELVNAVGQVVWSGAQIEDQDFSGLNKGMYFLKVYTEDSVQINKMIKQ